MVLVNSNTRGLIKSELNGSAAIQLANVGIGPCDSEVLTEGRRPTIDAQTRQCQTQNTYYHSTQRHLYL